MKTKTIRKVIRGKIDAWIESIDNEEVKALVKENTIVTGGCIASMLLQEPVNDYDLYFRNKETAIAVANYYIARFYPQSKKGIACEISVLEENDRIKIVVKSAGIASEKGTEVPYQYFESKAEGEAGRYVESVIQDPGDIENTLEEIKEYLPEEDKGKYRPVFLSTNAITLSDKVQLILRFFGEPETIHTYFDFVHCTNYWKSWDNELVLTVPALTALMARELVYVGSKYPICSVIRIRKFIKRGFMINAGQILKICMQISQLDLTNIETLQDQLTGVDAAYFMEVIGKLKDKDPEKVSMAYLIEIIDRMF